MNEPEFLQNKMTTIKLKGTIDINLSDKLPEVGALAPDFTAVKQDLSEVKLSDYKGKKVIINVFPSVDTAVCAASVRRFNEEAAKLDNSVVLCVSKDLPFALGRFCGAEGISGVETVSMFRCDCFEKGYGLLMETGPLKGLLARAVIVVNEEGKVIHTELVPEVTQEPDYEKAIVAIKG